MSKVERKHCGNSTAETQLRELPEELPELKRKREKCEGFMDGDGRFLTGLRPANMNPA
jgi:hypothetical protein